MRDLIRLLFKTDAVDAAAPAASLPGRHAKRVPFQIDFPFTKAAEAKSGDLELTGYANTWVLDRDFEVVDPRAFDDSLPAYLAKNPIVLWQHNPLWPIGQVVEAHTDDTGLWVRAVVRRELCLADGAEEELRTAYASIKAGVVRTFSVGGWFEREIRGQLLVITNIELWEISCVSIPSNPDSIYDAAVKAARGEQATGTLSELAISQMSQLIGADRVSDPQLVMLDAGQRERRYNQVAELYKTAGCTPPARDAWQQIEKRLDGGEDELAVLPDILQVVAQLRGAAKATTGPASKRGRVLSAANEGKLRDGQDLLEQAMAKVQDVLAALDTTDDTEEEQEPDAGLAPFGQHGAAAAAAAKGVFADHMVSEELSGDLCDGFYVLRCALSELLGLDMWYGGHGMDVAAINVGQVAATVDEFRDWLVARINDAKSADERGVLIEEAKALAVMVPGKGALSTPSLGFFDRDRQWSADSARASVKAWATTDDEVDPAKYGRAFLWRDDGAPNDQLTAYRFPVCDVDGDSLKYVPRGIFAAANVLQGGQGGSNIGDDGQAALKRSVERLYARMRDQFSDDTITVPWAD